MSEFAQILFLLRSEWHGVIVDKSAEDHSVTQTRGGFTVAASPFNPVKLDLGIISVVAVVVWFAHTRVTEAPLGQLLILLSYGLLAMAWLVWRVRRISRRLAQAGTDGPE